MARPVVLKLGGELLEEASRLQAIASVRPGANTYGFTSGSHYRASAYEATTSGTRFDVEHRGLAVLPELAEIAEQIAGHHDPLGR